MTKFKRTRNALKWTLISVPLGVLGYKQIKQGNKVMGNLIHQLANPTCPECNRGVMVLDEDADGILQENGEPLYPWHCNACEYFLFAPVDNKQTKNMVGQVRAENTLKTIGSIDDEELELYAKTQRMTSRVFFLCSVLTMFGFFYMVAFSDASFLICLNYLAIAIALWTFGMVRSYRHWQLMNRKLFIKGTFLQWVKTEKWMI